MRSYIKAISYYLPKTVVTNDELIKEFPEWTVEKIASKVGVSERHIAADDETAGDMALRAAEKLFTEYNINKATIDMVVLCTQSPDYFLPSTACIIQGKLGLEERCGSFDINLGCSGYEYGLAIAKGFIIAGISTNVLLLTAETYNKHIHPKDKGNRTIFGDAATATLVSTEGFALIGEFILGSDGNKADKLIHKTGGWRQLAPANDYMLDENLNTHSSDYLFMDGKAIFDFTADAVPTLVKDTMKINSTNMIDINLFVFHQANRFMINYLRKLIGIDKDKFYIYLEKVGNTVSSTVPIALREAQNEGKLKGKVLIAGFGVGLSYGATVLDCNIN